MNNQETQLADAFSLTFLQNRMFTLTDQLIKTEHFYNNSKYLN